MHERGEGVPVNKQEAAKLYSLAADQGNAEAQYNLALMYIKGEGVTQDLLLAYLHHSLAASLGDETLIDQAQELRDIAYGALTPSEQEEGQKIAARAFEKIQKRMEN